MILSHDNARLGTFLGIPHFLEEERKFLDFLFLRKSHLRLVQIKPLVVLAMMVLCHCCACALLFENLRQPIREDSSHLMNLAFSFLVCWLDAMHHRCCRGIACWMTLLICCFCMNDNGNINVQHRFFSRRLRNEGSACLKT